MGKGINISVKPTQDEIVLIQWLANDKSISEFAAEIGREERSVYAGVGAAKSKYGCRHIAGLVSLFHRNKLIK